MSCDPANLSVPRRRKVDEDHARVLTAGDEVVQGGCRSRRIDQRGQVDLQLPRTVVRQAVRHKSEVVGMM